MSKDEYALDKSAGQFADNEPEAQSTITEEPRTQRILWKFLVIGILLVLIIIALAIRRTSQNGSTPPAVTNSGNGAKRAFPPDTVLATVNATTITVADLDKDIQAVPEQYRAQLTSERHLFLNELVIKELMLQEAKSQNLQETEAYVSAMAAHAPHPGHEDHTLISLLLEKEVFGSIKVSEEEVRSFYDQNKARLPQDQTFQDLQEILRNRLNQAKEMGALETFIASLKNNAKIALNAEWIEAQQQAAADNPLDLVLGRGKPVLADFGRGTCTPCKMMKPILEQLAQDIGDTVHVLILDLGEYEHLGRRYETRIIPAQLFFDGNGKQLYRHEGFMTREDMISKLKELGMLSK